VYCSDIDAIVCYACMCMDVCVVFYDYVQSVRYTWWSRRRRRTL